jgi:transcriptional regulator with XRE-family HTH domain
MHSSGLIRTGCTFSPLSNLSIIAAASIPTCRYEEVAERTGTTQSVIARLEAGNSLPSMKSLYRYAEATGTTPATQLRNV